jgi:hypothetical protein
MVLAGRIRESAEGKRAARIKSDSSASGCQFWAAATLFESFTQSMI